MSPRTPFILLAALSLAPVCQAGPLDLAAVGHQIESADYAADSSALSKVQQSLLAATKQPNTDKYAYYYLGYADYSLADVYADTDPSKATDCLHDADDALDQAIKLDPAFAEAYALLGSSYGFEIGLHPYKGMWLGSKSDKLMAKAMRLAPDDPRVLMLQGLSDFTTPESYGGDKHKALQEFSTALANFGSYKPADAEAPTWGKAQAFVWRGDAEVKANDASAAGRDYQAALAMVPAYKGAARELAKLSGTKQG